MTVTVIFKVYQEVQLLGRGVVLRRTGSVHVKDRDLERALCGAEPGALSGGWAIFDPRFAPASRCSRCVERLEKLEGGHETAD